MKATPSARFATLDRPPTDNHVDRAPGRTRSQFSVEQQRGVTNARTQTVVKIYGQCTMSKRATPLTLKASVAAHRTNLPYNNIV
ncbi:hypothetical protein EVAR_91843_1 [Eumeta japonica]|uniref:Uncharacterized protein n=1 Tax=Eumeta variegata TaxID=151549 RepID=A0A4C2AE03_EUMVA|nr:hypothetical protein EVAR_91843_1 [Eumeta japonica]